MFPQLAAAQQTRVAEEIFAFTSAMARIAAGDTVGEFVARSS